MPQTTLSVAAHFCLLYYFQWPLNLCMQQCPNLVQYHTTGILITPCAFANKFGSQHSLHYRTSSNLHCETNTSCTVGNGVCEAWKQPPRFACQGVWQVCTMEMLDSVRIFISHDLCAFIIQLAQYQHADKGHKSLVLCLRTMREGERVCIQLYIQPADISHKRTRQT